MSGIAAGKFALRACIVNFRTSNADVDAVPEMIAEVMLNLVEIG